MIDDEWQQEWEQTMMIIARICYNKKWWEWCTIDEDDTMNEDFNNDEAFKNEDDNNECDDKWMNKIFQIECDAVANKISVLQWLFQVQFPQFPAIVDEYSTLFWFSSYLARMLCCMIRNDKMKLCDQNMLEHDDEVSLVTHDEYNQSNISEWWRQKVKNNHQNETWQSSESNWSLTFWRQQNHTQ